MWSRFRTWLQARKPRPARRVYPRRLLLEPLEDRCLLSAPVLSTLASFGAPYGSQPQAGLIMDQSGNLYGTTTSGGVYGDGVIFELAKGSSTITTLASFNGTDGLDPVAPLLMDSSGNLYGTAERGGTSGDGTIFELAKGSSTITTLASFNGSNGENPYAPLVMDSSGNLYGATELGGASSAGTVFELAKGSSTITTLASFNGKNGSEPYGSLVLDTSGNLYGTTVRGGSVNDGTVFELAKGSSTITTLASFNGTNGSEPLGGLVLDTSGNLYGTTDQGGAYHDGTVFELAEGSHTIDDLASFQGSYGANPLAALIIDPSGNLYGTTRFGGASGDGTIFELAKGSGTITPLASFNSTDNGYTLSSLVMDSSGNLYGTTINGGSDDGGTVFELTKGSGAITTLATFVNNGLYPDSSLVMDASGNLYGTTASGGAFGEGTVFEIAKGSGTVTTLASFNGTNGSNPVGSLVMDSSGNLYGVTEGGGANYDGTVFELAKGSSTITTLGSFNGFDDGANPVGSLVMDSSGNLYGTTANGGEGGYGTIFEVVKGSGTITDLTWFTSSGDAYTDASLAIDSKGNLYGTTYYGGTDNFGSIFELAKGSRIIKQLASFNDKNGEYPVGSLIVGASGNLYGTTLAGGPTNGGTVFELAAHSHAIKNLVFFDGTNGVFPAASLIMDSKGNLFGTTEYGGASNDGTVFELAKGSKSITTLTSFDGSNGSDLQAALIMDTSGNLYGTTVEGGALSDGTVFELTTG
jgi:uncharacterized repeat protein (TIGR03803 family)